MNSITKGEKTFDPKTFDPKSFAESFRENLLNVSKKVYEIPSTTTTPNVKELNIPRLNVSSVSSVKNSFSFWNIFKFSLAMLFITVLAVNVYSFVTEGVDAYSYMFNSKPKSQEKELTLNQDEKDSGEDDTAIDVAAEKISKENKKNPTELENVMENVMENSENNVKDSLETNIVEKATDNYKANNVSLNAKSKAGYCYAGSDRGVRTCVKVGEDDVCMSGEIYPSLDLCVNPNLKN